MSPEPLPDPLLLLLDDLGDLAVDEDGVRRDVDLGLGVVEARDLRVSRRSSAACGGAVRRSGDRQSKSQVRISLARRPVRICSRIMRIACGSSRPCASIWVPSPRVIVHLLLARQPEQRQRGGDLREGVVVDVVPGVEGGLVRDAGDLAEPAGRVRVGDLLPG